MRPPEWPGSDTAAWQALFDRGIITYKSTGLAGVDGDAIIVAPPFVMDSADFEYVAGSIRTAIEQVLAD